MSFGVVVRAVRHPVFFLYQPKLGVSSRVQGVLFWEAVHLSGPVPNPLMDAGLASSPGIRGEGT